MGKPGMAGAHTNQRLSLSKPWEGLRRTCRGFEPDSGNLTVRDYRGASRNVRHGEIVTPSRNRKSGNGNPFTYSGARSNSIPTAKRARKAETPKQPSLYLMLRAPYLYPDSWRACTSCLRHRPRAWSSCASRSRASGWRVQYPPRCRSLGRRCRV